MTVRKIMSRDNQYAALLGVLAGYPQMAVFFSTDILRNILVAGISAAFCAAMGMLGKTLYKFAEKAAQEYIIKRKNKIKKP